MLEEAEQYLWQFAREQGHDALWVTRRMGHVRRETRVLGTYNQTPAELVHGGRVAWRNSARCIGRFYWRSLRVIDQRSLRTPEHVFGALVHHLDESTNGGRIRPMLSVFRPGIRIVNSQLVRYAGYRRPDGGVTGDPAALQLTALAQSMGWRGAGTPFDVLPIIIDVPGWPRRMFTLPPESVVEVPLVHPGLPAFADLGLRWHALPAISNHVLRCGGIDYTCAPFSGWYMGTEIGARNLADPGRYNMLPAVAALLDLDTRQHWALWRDQALVTLNQAVLYSFKAAGVTIVDHHTESRRFLQHLEREEQAGRRVPTDWSWIVPPISGAATPVFHRYYDEPAGELPNFIPPTDVLDPAPAFAAS